MGTFGPRWLVWACGSSGLLAVAALYLLDLLVEDKPGWFWLLLALLALLGGLFIGLLVSALQRVALTDNLTGLPNRRYFYAQLERELFRHRRSSSPLSVVMVDLDNFKKVNDVYGHLEGDRVLKRLATFLRRHRRAQDTLARWGGEEFALILPEAGLSEALALAERLRQLLQTRSFGPVAWNVTASIGVATTTERNASADELVRRADDALYRAKRTRNTVCSDLNGIPQRERRLPLASPPETGVDGRH